MECGRGAGTDGGATYLGYEEDPGRDINSESRAGLDKDVKDGRIAGGEMGGKWRGGLGR